MATPSSIIQIAMTAALAGASPTRAHTAPSEETERGRIDPFVLTVTIVNLGLAAAMLVAAFVYLVG